MEKEKIISVCIVAVILILAGSIIFFKNFQGSTIANTPEEKVAKWIGEHSELYVVTGCIHCKEQEDLFGSNVKYLTIFDGAKEEDMQKFIEAGIERTPTWIINEQKYEGVQSIEKLKELTGYQD